jgi:hypothetical protein
VVALAGGNSLIVISGVDIILMRLSSDGNSLTGRLLSGITSTILLLGGESSTAEKTLFGRNGVGSRVSARLTKACRLA